MSTMVVMQYNPCKRNTCSSRIHTIEGGRQESDNNTRLFVMLTGDAYHPIVQIITKLVPNFMINRSRHAGYLVYYSLDVMYEMKKTQCGKGLADNLIEDKIKRL
jgi:hypothetical protein